MFGLIMLLVTVVNFVLFGFVFQDLWGWFMTPFGLPVVSYAHAWGLALLFDVNAMNIKQIDIRAAGEATDEEKITRSVTVLVGYLFLWGLGWIFKGQM